MKAAFMEGPEQFTVRECPVPSPSDNEVLIKVRACSVCGSDLTMYKMGMTDRILGHEFSGEIAGVGPGVKGWKPGDRVTIEPQLICGECHWCRTGHYNLCDSLQYTGLATDGGFAEYAIVPQYQLHRLPDTVSFEEGALMEPLAVSLRGVRRSGMKPGDAVAVFGCGAIGLFTILWAGHFQTGMIIASDVSAPRLEAAAKLADHTFNPTGGTLAEEIAELTGGLGADIVFECSGSSQAQTDAVDSVRKGGTVLLLGIGYESTPVPLMQLTMREVEMKGSLGYLSLSDEGEFSRALEAAASGSIDLSGIPFGTYTLDEVGKAFAASHHAETPKAIVVMQ